MGKLVNPVALVRSTITHREPSRGTSPPATYTRTLHSQLQSAQANFVCTAARPRKVPSAPTHQQQQCRPSCLAAQLRPSLARPPRHLALSCSGAQRPQSLPSSTPRAMAMSVSSTAATWHVLSGHQQHSGFCRTVSQQLKQLHVARTAPGLPGGVAMEPSATPKLHFSALCSGRQQHTCLVCF